MIKWCVFALLCRPSLACSQRACRAAPLKSRVQLTSGVGWTAHSLQVSDCKNAFFSMEMRFSSFKNAFSACKNALSHHGNAFLKLHLPYLMWLTGMSAGPLFGDQGPLGLIVEEMWPGAVSSANGTHSLAGSTPVSIQQQTLLQQQQAQQQTQINQTQLQQQRDKEAEDSDSDDDSDYEAFDVREDAAADAWHATDPR